MIDSRYRSRRVAIQMQLKVHRMFWRIRKMTHKTCAHRESQEYVECLRSVCIIVSLLIAPNSYPIKCRLQLPLKWKLLQPKLIKFGFPIQTVFHEKLEMMITPIRY